MESLYEKTAIVVSRSEELDPDDRVTINYEVIFLIEDEDEVAHTTFTLHTDDKLVYDRFVTGKKADLKCLSKEQTLEEIPRKRAN